MAFAILAHLIRRGDVYYFRRAIPKALVEVFGRHEIKISLQTDQRPTATIRCREMTNAFDRLLERVGDMAALTQEQIENLLRAYFVRQWATAKEIDYICRHKLDRELDKAHELEMSLQEAETLRQRAADGSYSAANRADVHELLEAHGYAIDKIGLEDINILCNGILRAQSETHRILAAMLEKRTEDTEPRDPLFKGVREPGLPPMEGEMLSPATEPAPAVSNDLLAKEAPLPTGEPLSEIFEAWKAEKKPDRQLAGEFGKSVRRFTELHGDVPAIAINKPMIREYKAALLKLPRAMSAKIRALKLPDLLLALEKAPPAKTISGGTVDKDLGALSAILAWAGKQGYFDANPSWSNPVAGMKLGADWDDEDGREPYSMDDLKLIFNSSVYSQGKRPKGGAGEAAKWLPLLGLLTGARLEELGQALVADICEEDGVPYLAITTKGGGKSVKTKTSVRDVPFHPWLIRLGFLAYVEERRKAGDLHLFPDLKLDRNQKRTGNWSKWWGRHADSLGITDPLKVFHSFRHGFKGACRTAEIEEEIHDRLTGHTPANVGRTYGKYSVKLLAGAVAKIDFGVDLSHLIPKKSD